MASPARGSKLARLLRFRRQRRVQNLSTLGLALLGPLLTFLTFIMLGPLDEGVSSRGLRIILLVDLIYILVVAGLVATRVARMVAARRAKSAGSQLHLRLSAVFAAVALGPTILVAAFAAITVNMGLEGWFSDRVRNVVGTSLSAAQAYEEEHRRNLLEDAQAMADYFAAAHRVNPILSEGDLRGLLTQLQSQVQRGLKEAYVIDGDRQIVARGERSYLFDYEAPKLAEIRRASEGNTIIIEDWSNNEFRALVKLEGYLDRFLFISRTVDGELLSLMDDTQETVHLYNQLESDRGKLLFEFGLLYLGFALILILAATWLGLWFAERLSRPVGRLAGAVQRVGGGDLDVQVPEERGDDEIAMLGRIFNQMTRQLKTQRSALVESHQVTESRRRQFDTVLSSVTAGVMGLDAEGRIDFINRSACRLLLLHEQEDHGRPLSRAVPEFSELFTRLLNDPAETQQEEIKVGRNGVLESLLVRMALRKNSEDEVEGYVVTFDDVTDLVSAQRMAAWGDVARRIAHEIKNPLTPIQLSAERIRRKFRPLVDDEADKLEQMTDVIVRQTNDLRRIVDEFSKFARMPEPEQQEEDIVQILRDAVFLQESAQEETRIVSDIPSQEMIGDIDRTMISQALTNLIKNAGEAIESLKEKGAPEGFQPEIRVNIERLEDMAVISIADNGIGLPEDRARLFEPYVTTREKGTGLGLPIVKKIIDEHGGTLTLSDAPPFGESAHVGALAEIRLPLRTAVAEMRTKEAV